MRILGPIAAAAVFALWGAGTAQAGDRDGASAKTATPATVAISAQRRLRPRARIRVFPLRREPAAWPYPRPGEYSYPGPGAVRDCAFRLAQEWRPSGTVVVPVQHCWWSRG